LNTNYFQLKSIYEIEAMQNYVYKSK